MPLLHGPTQFGLPLESSIWCGAPGSDCATRIQIPHLVGVQSDDNCMPRLQREHPGPLYFGIRFTVRDAGVEPTAPTRKEGVLPLHQPRVFGWRCRTLLVFTARITERAQWPLGRPPGCSASPRSNARCHPGLLPLKAAGVPVAGARLETLVDGANPRPPTALVGPRWH